jgi:hypothetical protein
LALGILLAPRHLPLSVHSTKSEKQELATAMKFPSVKSKRQAKPPFFPATSVMK